jgi:hypothetical protein
MEKTKPKQEYGKNMCIISGVWNNTDTFKLIPVIDSCPYSEVIFDPLTSLLVVISKNTKENLQMVPRLNKDGKKMLANPFEKGEKPQFKQERLRVQMFTEYYIMNTNEQIDFIEMFAVNSGEFDYQNVIKKANANKTQEMGFNNDKMILPESNIIIK